MAHRFEITKELEVGATPEQVWEAIATGPGMDSWFMGRSEVEPREGGRPRRFVNSGGEGPDGSFHRFDYRIEDRGSGRTAIRYVHSGMLGVDWEAEYEG